MHDVNGKTLHINDFIVTQAYGIMQITGVLDEDNAAGDGALVYVSDTTGYGRGNLRLQAAGAIKLPDMKVLARVAVEVQDACNLAAVVDTFSWVISDLRTLLRAQVKEGIIEKFSTDILNEHPVCVLFASKIVSLTHYDDEGTHPGSFSHAYDWAKEQMS